MIDRDLEASRKYMKGTVLDIGGGRKRGRFVRNPDARWIIVDINRQLCPDVMADAHLMPVRSASIDCIKCTELLEHVRDPEEIVTEMARVLKPGGVLILSIPFLFPLHSDPFDFQRLTDVKIKGLLSRDFRVLTIKKQGLFFTVLAGMVRQAIFNARPAIRVALYPLGLLMDVATRLDGIPAVSRSGFYSSYTTGFFTLAEKKVKAPTCTGDDCYDRPLCQRGHVGI
jgi:SAM-dependent methyltransferase